MKKKILILNWRDPQSPLEGGAERFTLKYAEFWRSLGHSVFWLTNNFQGSKPIEERDGITYIRVGPELNGRLSSYFFKYPFFLVLSILAARRIVKSEKINIVIDEIHGFPFFTPLFLNVKTVLLVCEVAGPIWDKMFPFPINLLGKTLERVIYSLYSKSDIWAISKNTRKNINQLLPKKRISVIDLGFSYEKSLFKQAEKTRKTSYPSAIFLARLVQMKGIEATLQAMPEILARYPSFKLVVVGKGLASYERKLHSLTKQLKIASNVEFKGHRDGAEKYQLLAQAHFLLHPSYKEGFGLTLIEAGAVGTPAIIRAGSSMDALVENGLNGYTFKLDSELAICVIRALSTPNYQSLSRKAKQTALYYTWDKVLKRSRFVTKL